MSLELKTNIDLTSVKHSDVYSNPQNKIFVFQV